MDTVEMLPVKRITKEGESNTDQEVATEFLVTIFLNGKEMVTLLCSPKDLNYLAVGFLVSEGLLKSKDEIKKIEIDDWLGVVRIEIEGSPAPDSRLFAKRLIASGCGGAATFYSGDDATIPKVKSQMKISADEIFALVNKFQHSSEVYLATHGVHSAALCDKKSMLVFNEDIGRHSAIDKIFGKCLLEDIPIKKRLIVSSGRITSEILHKVARRGVPILISISAPTSLGVKIANELGITLVGSVKGKKMNVYTHDWRVSCRKVGMLS
ncbi:MAG: formate dehydrogenase accessory sulfurtransferase FdhD [Dehalococcoidales bacterium]|jgi:FdhD protein|nr:formate dehydrogenase accessory sulfurtransferase FdhD [Dehalococcoidales bacterium]